MATINGYADAPDENLRLFVDGEWRESEHGETFTATNPATGDSLGEVPAGTRRDARDAIEAARDVQPELERMTAFERADLCRELADAVEENGDELASWLTADQGKPLDGAYYEIDGCAELFRLAAKDVETDEMPTLPSRDPNKRIYTMRKPHGVYGVITPWNFPLNIPAEYLGPGLAAGNALVWCPAPTTAVIAEKLMEVFEETSLPDGAINLVTGEGPVVGNELVVNDGVDAVGFTGSPETGEEIAREAGAKPTLLEMGGNGPVVVCADADVDAAVEGAAGGCYGNAGQICSASERILVHEDVHDEFVEKLLAHTEGITVGDPTDDATDMGPLNNAGVAEKMDRHVEQAVDAGADLLTGGGRVEDAPTDLYYQPTVIDGVTPEMTVNHEESFGPIAPIVTFSDNEEAVEIANGIDLGLTSGVFTSNVGTMEYFADRIETGIVNVNAGSTNWEKHVPFGGYTGKNSGVGRLGGRFTLEEMSQVKTVFVDSENVRDPSGN